jgi:hypothetical protein
LRWAEPHLQESKDGAGVQMDHNFDHCCVTALESTSLKAALVTAQLPITLECVAYSWLAFVQIANS